MRNRWPHLLLLMATMAAAQMHPAAMSAPPSGSPMLNGSMIECPWLTRGTAAAVLGGDVLLDVSKQDHSEGSCMFRGLQNPNETLSITVSLVAPQACRKNSIKVVGIANWAMECSSSGPHHRHIESVSGQARDTYFTVTLSFRQKEKWRTREVDVEHVAEMVAGSLY